ncbi:MAG: HlyD family efflux transporter periplasmic adaptor subunit [Bacteriovoracaceae bacterium]|nr:HlyD family efflux transporter periplasmic adaptor subunit [Bacteriovoracaceae bacterium]
MKSGAVVKKGQILAQIIQNVVGQTVLPVKIQAPIAGKLMTPKFRQNSLLHKNALIFSIFDPLKLKLEINIPPEDTAHISLGDKINVLAAKETIIGEVISISPNIDQSVGTQLVEISITLPSKSKIIPGSMGRVFLQYGHHQGHLVDKKVVKKKAGKYIVYLLDEHSKVQEAQVTLKDKFKGQVEIVSELLTKYQSVITKSSKKYLSKDQLVEVVKK